MEQPLSATALSDLMQARRTTLPKRLYPPGPDAQQLQRILEAAASAPDHGQLLPWRFVRIGSHARTALGEAFAAALRERDPQATAEQVAQAQEKAQRAPLLLLVVVDAARGDTAIDLPERMISAGCAVQNMLLMATALGFGSALTSGKALHAQALRALFQLQASEHALCFISIGTVLQVARKERVRPVPAEYVSDLSSWEK